MSPRRMSRGDCSLLRSCGLAQKLASVTTRAVRAGQGTRIMYVTWTRDQNGVARRRNYLDAAGCSMFETLSIGPEEMVPWNPRTLSRRITASPIPPVFTFLVALTTVSSTQKTVRRVASGQYPSVLMAFKAQRSGAHKTNLNYFSASRFSVLSSSTTTYRYLPFHPQSREP